MPTEPAAELTAAVLRGGGFAELVESTLGTACQGAEIPGDGEGALLQMSMHATFILPFLLVTKTSFLKKKKRRLTVKYFGSIFLKRSEMY